jgi:amidase
VIRPASFCGVVGYKPTHGQFSYAGVKLLAGSLDTLGAFARHVEDLALLRAALLAAPGTVAAPASPPRLGFCRTPWWDQADPSTQSAVAAAADSARTAGAAVEDVSLPGEFAALADANQTIMFFEGRRSLAYEFDNHEDKLSARLKSSIPSDLAVSYDAYQEAIGVAIDCRRRFHDLLMDYDALIVPSAVGEAPEGLESTGNALFNRPWTTIGAPCVTLPAHRGHNGLPVGVQLVARPGADEALLAVAKWVETSLK